MALSCLKHSRVVPSASRAQTTLAMRTYGFLTPQTARLPRRAGSVPLAQQSKQVRSDDRRDDGHERIELLSGSGISRRARMQARRNMGSPRHNGRSALGRRRRSVSGQCMGSRAKRESVRLKDAGPLPSSREFPPPLYRLRNGHCSTDNVG